MKLRSLKSFSLIMGSLACVSLPLSAAAPLGGDSLDRAQTPPASGMVGQTTGDATAMPPGVSASQVSAPDTARFSDGRILAIVTAVDQHEIDAAEKALKKKPGAEVRDYARMLKKEHSANLAKSKKLAKTLDLKAEKSAIADSLKAKGESQGKSLASLKGAEYEKAFIGAMVAGHAEMLEMIDTQLIPNARNDSLKSHLTEARGHIASHLELGKRLQGANASNSESE